MTESEFRIRRCEPSDWDAVYEVCLKTGDAGQDATHLYEDPKALGNIFVGPYMRLEPALAFVLEDGKGVCGYVLGAFDSRRFYRLFVETWLPELHRVHPEPKGDPATWTRTQRCYHDYYHPDTFCPEPYAEYPSHVHIDLLPRAQGRGLGGQMMRRVLDVLVAQGSPGVHLGMWISNTRAERFYKKLGFHELERVGESLYLGKRLP